MKIQVYRIVPSAYTGFSYTPAERARPRKRPYTMRLNLWLLMQGVSFTLGIVLSCWVPTVTPQAICLHENVYFFVFLMLLLCFRSISLA